MVQTSAQQPSSCVAKQTRQLRLCSLHYIQPRSVLDIIVQMSLLLVSGLFTVHTAYGALTDPFSPFPLLTTLCFYQQLVAVQANIDSSVMNLVPKLTTMHQQVDAL